jgi:D-beta-D-heptose 7-phosphate kinase/D-beta-D-heptose 1-phosphate adenosyltransferase
MVGLHRTADARVHQRLAEAVGKLESPRVFVVGDVMLDRYVWGAVHRVSPEAPVQILNVQREEDRAGGAANVAHNLAALGARVTCAGVVGRDPAGAALARLLRRLGVRPALVADGAKPTAVKTRMIAHNQQMLRVDSEKAEPASSAVERRLAAAIDAAGRTHDVALVSDYAKGALTARVCARVLRAFRGKPVLVGLKSRDCRKYRGATGAALNRPELAQLSGEDDVERGAARLLKSLGLEFLIVTLGERGMLVAQGGRTFRLPAIARQVYDVTGAGDTVLSAFALGHASGLDLELCAILANAAAGIVVGKVGTATVTRQELLDSAASGDGAHRKVLDRRALARAVAAERARGRRVVFTNGCFDLLHPGHVQSLQFAKAKGDVLVVAINSDRSVRALKGPSRPVLDERGRAAVLSALECVDYVTVFDEDTPVALLRLLRPDVLVKGGDYGPAGVVGREIVEGYGGRVEMAPLVKGMSTTGLVSRMRGRR